MMMMFGGNVKVCEKDEYISSSNRHSDVSGKKYKSLYVNMSICRRYDDDLHGSWNTTGMICIYVRSVKRKIPCACVMIGALSGAS